MGPELRTAQEEDAGHAVPDRLLPQECEVRSGFDYPPMPCQEELEEAMDEIATCQEAHSTGQGGVESVCTVMLHSRAITVHAQQSITAIKHEAWQWPVTSLLGREGVHEK